MRSCGAVLLAVLLALGCQGGGGPVEMKVTRNGFEPALVRASKGKLLELVVTRTTDETCVTEIVIPEAGLNVPLPLGKPVKIAFTPQREGRLRFACAMGMFPGTIEVR
jgi:plastocyanin domain-containing protein